MTLDLHNCHSIIEIGREEQGPHEWLRIGEYWRAQAVGTLHSPKLKPSRSKCHPFIESWGFEPRAMEWLLLWPSHPKLSIWNSTRILAIRGTWSTTSDIFCTCKVRLSRNIDHRRWRVFRIFRTSWLRSSFAIEVFYSDDFYFDIYCYWPRTTPFDPQRAISDSETNSARSKILGIDHMVRSKSSRNLEKFGEPSHRERERQAMHRQYLHYDTYGRKKTQDDRWVLVEVRLLWPIGL